MEVSFLKYVLKFKTPAGTSRGTITEKETWFLLTKKNGVIFAGECGILKTLSPDDTFQYKEKIVWACQNFNLPETILWENLKRFPSIQFGVEQLKNSLKNNKPWIIFPSEFTKEKKGIPINGLIWMGDKNFMRQQINEKISSGFKCLKLKIGSLKFSDEIQIIKNLRRIYSKNDLDIRLDANGAFSPKNALEKLNQLSTFSIHSIEQPIMAGQQTQMASICNASPIPIALDEELINSFDYKSKEELLDEIKPTYIILKPSLIGGIRGSEEWIVLAKKKSIGWWVTSALESNIGLNAISQWVFTKSSKLNQGLGTGNLYTNNIASPLKLKKHTLFFETKKSDEKICLDI